jgi:hypothetical protein
LRPAAVADCASRRGDPAVERRIGDDPPAPHRRQEIVLADDALAVLQEIDEEIEDLRLRGYPVTATAQLATRGVEHMVAEQKPQSGPPAGSLGRLAVTRVVSRNNHAFLQAKSSSPASVRPPQLDIVAIEQPPRRMADGGRIECEAAHIGHGSIIAS